MLGIFGDSFTHIPEHRLRDKSRKDLSYLEILNNKLNIHSKNYSMSATSIWYSYTNFIENYQKYDKIIFCYSSHLRWFYFKPDFKWLSNIGTHGKYVIPNMQGWTDEAKRVGTHFAEVYDYIFDENLQLYVYQKIFNDVNRICKENKIQLCNIMPFETNEHLIDLSFRAGSCITSLHVVSLKESTTGKHFAEKLAFNLINGKTHDPRFHHLNQINNMRLADCVENNFNTNYIVDFSKYEGLDYSDNLLEFNYDCY